MSTEFELYKANVPHGETVFEFGDWSVSQLSISATSPTGKITYINTIRFSISTGASISSGSIDISGGSFVKSITDIAEFFVYADPFSLKSIAFDGTNEAITGEIKFNPPVKILAEQSFSIEPNALTLAVGGYGPYFVIKGWVTS